MEDKISVVGISTSEGQVGPEGNHLRWSFSGWLGFPPNGFYIYRKEGRGKPQRKMEGADLVLTPSGGNPAQLELNFPQSVAHLVLEITGSGSGSIRAFRDTRLLALVSADTEVAEIYCAGITRLVINSESRRIRSLTYATEEDICRAGEWQRIKTLPPPRDADEALITRFESGLSNYYATSRQAAREKYGPRVFELIRWLHRLLAPTGTFFEDATARPDRLKIRSDSGAQLQVATYLQSALLLAALDPNIARLLSLYWVDAFNPPAEEAEFTPPNPNLFYDYKVEGVWANGKSYCGLLLILGRPPAPQPELKSPLEGHQHGGLRWVNETPRGRIGLKWPRPGIQFSPGNGIVKPVQPVLYELTRFYEDKAPQTLGPVLVNRNAWDNSHLYLDRDVELGTYVYEARPIDIFGQLGSALTSPPIPVEDLEAPPPPIRVRAQISQASAPDHVRLQFEFGASQHQQAPDVTGFTPYWRPDTLLTRGVIRVSVTSAPDGPDTFIHTLRIRHESQPPILISVGDVITNVITGEQPPRPADQRRRYRVAEVQDDDVLILEPTTAGMTGGDYEVVQDPHNRLTWNKLEGHRVPWRTPLDGRLLGVREGLPVVVVGLPDVTRRPNPFTSIPAEQRGRQFPDVSPPPEFVEVEIDRLLTEPEVFAGGTAERGGENLKLIYVVTNPEAGRTRLALPAGTTVGRGETLTLFPPTQPPSQLSAKVRLLRIRGTVEQTRLETPGGEVAFKYARNEEEVTVIMRVVSNAVNRADAFDLVVRADSARDITRLQPNSTQLRYYAPFVLNIPLTLAEGGAAPIGLPLRPSEGYRDGFIALNATDVRDNEGPLSTPAQFSVIRPRPTGRPSRPYPCGNDTEAEGYASPPNRSGRATVCLKWEAETLSPAEGVRYDVARALDSSIPVAHLRAWQTGKIMLTAAPVIAGERVEGILSGVTLKDGLIHATFTPDTQLADPTLFRNGRLRLTPAQTSPPPPDTCLQVTLAKLQKPSNGTLDLVLRGPASPLPTSGRATLEAPPDYSEARSDVPTLQALALEAPDVFALVTGVPIEATSFIDDVAGKGRNSFFYRVRAVDAAENRSDWSDISAPFHQADTTPPDAPRQFRIAVGDRTAALIWDDPGRQTDSEYAVYRSTDGAAEPFDQTTVNHYALLQPTDLRRPPLLALAGSLNLAQPIEFKFSRGVKPEEVSEQLSQQIIVQEAVDAAAPNLYDAASSRAVFELLETEDAAQRVRVRQLSGLRPGAVDSPLKVRLGQETREQDDSALTWTDTGLQGAKTYTYRIAELLKIPAGFTDDGLLRVITVLGPASTPVTVTGLDRSKPQATDVTTLWIDGGPQDSATALAEITFRITSGNPSDVQVQRRAIGDAVWQMVASDTGNHWRPLPPANGDSTSIRLHLTRSGTHELRLRFRTATGLLGDFSSAGSLAALT